MLNALELVIRLLEKVSVLVSVALVLLMLRPAEVWLGETGSDASLRRRVFLVAILGALAIWGAFLGFELNGIRFNVRMVGIIVAGYLGGAWVGLAVGAAAGAVSVFVVPAYALYAATASVLTGIGAGWWSKRFGTRMLSAVIGAVALQLGYHVVLGGIFAAAEFQHALKLAGFVGLHAAKIAANAIGVTVFVGLLKLVQQLEQFRREVEDSRDLVRSARLEALQYQVRPHFLFNILNTLAYLIRTNSERARELTLDLAEFLRHTLTQSDQEMTLREELEQIERYVDLERARFGEGLDFEIDLSLLETHDLLDEVIVPPLILQPLVENAIRHGSEEESVAVRLIVQTVDDGTRCRIRVLDDGPGPQRSVAYENTAPPVEQGMGLSNVQERLKRFYNGETTLRLCDRSSLEGEQTQGACAELVLPVDGEHPALGIQESLKRRAREQLSWSFGGEREVT
jgi:LytS/YehU family sensor histidine kinase